MPSGMFKSCIPNKYTGQLRLSRSYMNSSKFKDGKEKTSKEK